MARRLRVIQKFWQLRLPFQVLIILVLAVFVGSTVYAGLGGFTDPPLQVNLSQGLVGYWSFDGDANDYSGNNQHGTVGGATLTVDRFGNPNSAYDFDGADDYIQIPLLPSSPSAFTVSAWAQGVSGPSALGGWGYVVHRGSASSIGSSLIWLGVNANGKLGASFDGNFNEGASTTDASNTAWHLITLTYDGSVQRVYIDGVLSASYADVTVNNSQGGVMGIGSRPSDPTYRPFDGQVDDVRIYNRAINNTEVDYLYKGFGSAGTQGRIQVSDTQKGLMGHWKFDGNAKDSSPTYGHFDVNSATLTTDRKEHADSAYSLDGAGQYLSTPDKPAYSPSSITASAWIYPTADTGTSGNIISKNGNNEYRYRRNSGGTITVFDRGATNALTTSAIVPLNQWTHVAFTGDSSGIKIYINGQLSQAGGSAYGAPDTAGRLFIGTYAGTNEYFAGKIDDVRIYNWAMSQTEIQRLADSYDANISVSDLQKQLIGYWDLNLNAKDKSSYYQHGIVTGAALAADRRSRSNSAYSFNGSSEYIDLPSSTAANATAAITMSLWYKATDNTNPSGHRMMLSLESATYMSLNNSSNITPFISMRINGAQRTLESNVNTTPGVWYHVAATWGGGTIKIYVNGQLQNTSTSYAGTLNTGSALKRIGRYVNNTAGYTFNGSIDDVRVYGRELNSAEILRLYETYK